MTNGWVDIKNADVILAMGGNPAENHPVGFKWFIEAKKVRGAKLVVVDPRFTRTAAVADFYAPLRPGTDIAFLLGLIRYALNTNRYQEEYVKIHTNGPFIIKNEYAFNDALFSGWDPTTKQYVKDRRPRGCTPRSLQPSRSDGHGWPYGDSSGLSHDTAGSIPAARGLLQERHPHDAEPTGMAQHELLGQLPDIHGLSAEVRVRERGNQRQRLGLRLVAQDRRQLFMDVHLRRHVSRLFDARRRQGAGTGGFHHLRNEPGGTGPELQEDDRRALEIEMDGGRRER